MTSDDTRFLEVTAALAGRLADSAVWFGGRCNWIGPPAHDDPHRPGGQAVQAALGPDLYAGSSGVALFLAEVGARLGDERLCRTALGAIQHAVDHADRIDPTVRDGLYAGSIGVAYAGARIARLLDAEIALAGAREVLAAWWRDRTPPVAADVFAGCAGALAGLVAVAEPIDEPWLLDAAVDIAADVLARVETSDAGWSWPAPGQRRMYSLCGYAHGAAGVGHALLELFGVTGERGFLEAGERAFDYEQRWFERGGGSWPDLRGIARRAGPDVPAPESGSWCHGAPGIALARLRAARLVRPSRDRHDAAAAVAATRRLVSRLLSGRPEDFSLCHGAAGAADVLLYAQDRSGLAVELGLLGVERCHRPGATFPCAAPGRQAPGLFLGLAGIGLFYLRLDDPGIPTPLLIQRRDVLDMRRSPPTLKAPPAHREDER